MVTRVIYVPFNAAGVSSGVARMPQAVHSAGVEHRLPAPVESTWIEVSGLTQQRGPSGLVSEDALATVVTDTAAAIGETWSGGHIPVVVAGDCTVLLAPLIAAADRCDAGLVFIDGHEDAWDPRVTPTGEASDCEIGLALGLFNGPTRLGHELPCLQPANLVVLGPRDQAEIADAGQSSIRDRVAHYRSGAQLATEQSYAEIADAVEQAAASAPAGWWCHVDLDVLDTASLAAVDYPQPGGLTWNQLESLTAACLSVPGCLGASVVIYNPDLDGGRAAERIADYVAFIRDRLGADHRETR
ncbi:arginase family protein [Mycobacterium sp.]|uniref:arginase family protein n=1 Tax=Mycobacterium sp. TaxID=1785 RepID=UPI002D896FCB|nr:arginase family protein [Mycobacterium sp.]